MPRTTRKTKSRTTPRPYRWETLDDDELLRWRFCDLGLRIEDSIAWPQVERLYAELDRRGIRFRPRIWLSTDWFSPDSVPGIAVPYFVAHPRLRRLERRMTGEVEGGSSKWRHRILRHEAGHAIDTAYRLRRRSQWRRIFGHASSPYPRVYTVRPSSRRYVQHLGYWYAQSHPTEDFAETFAVWLQPKSRWRRDYANWPALKKLDYVDALMEQIGREPARNRHRTLIAPLAENKRTLGEHYRRKPMMYGSTDRYDGWLTRVFAHRERRPKAIRAGRFLAEMEAQLRSSMLRRTRVTPYLVDHTVEMIAQRTRELDLVLRGPRRDNIKPVKRLHERVIYDVLRRNHERYAL